MTEVRLILRRLVVHGSERFDAAEFGDALQREVARRLGKELTAKTIAARMQGGERRVSRRCPRLDPKSHEATSPSDRAGREVAGHLLR